MLAVVVVRNGNGSTTVMIMVIVIVLVIVTVTMVVSVIRAFVLVIGPSKSNSAHPNEANMPNPKGPCRVGYNLARHTRQGQLRRVHHTQRSHTLLIR